MDFSTLVNYLIIGIVFLGILLALRFFFVDSSIYGAVGVISIYYWNRLKENILVYNNPHNISQYSKTGLLHAFLRCFNPSKIRNYKIFKNMRQDRNLYFWNHKVVYKNFYYTSEVDEPSTINYIITLASLDHIPTTSLFFECCFISFILKENSEPMSHLAKHGWVRYENMLLIAQDYFSGNDPLNIVERFKGHTPDLSIIDADDQLYVFDGYDGSSMREIQRKQQSYNEIGNVVIYSSGISAIQQFGIHSHSFRFHGQMPPFLAEYTEHDFNAHYFEEYSYYKKDVQYWLRCRIADKIIKRK